MVLEGQHRRGCGKDGHYERSYETQGCIKLRREAETASMIGNTRIKPSLPLILGICNSTTWQVLY